MALLTIQTTARLLNVSPITVRRDIVAGYLPALWVRGEPRVRREVLDRFVKPVEARPRRVMPWAPRLGKPLTENGSLWSSVGMAGSADEPKTDVASNKHEYLASWQAPMPLARQSNGMPRTRNEVVRWAAIPTTADRPPTPVHDRGDRVLPRVADFRKPHVRQPAQHGGDQPPEAADRQVVFAGDAFLQDLLVCLAPSARA